MKKTTLLLMLLPVLLMAGDVSVTMEDWLVTGPFETALPLFHDDSGVNGDTFGLDDLLTFEEMDAAGLRPADGDAMPRGVAQNRWVLLEGDTSGVLLHSAEQGENPQVAYLAAYIKTNRFLKAKLALSGAHLFQVWLDDAVLFSKTAAEKEEVKEKFKEMTLEPGTHRILVKTVKDPECRSLWTLKGRVDVAEELLGALTVSPYPWEVMTVSHMLDGPKVSRVSVSADGQLAAVFMSQSQPPSDSPERWVEIRRIRDGALLRSFRGMDLSSIHWAPLGQVFTYTQRLNGTSTLWMTDWATGESRALLEEMENLGRSVWSPAGDFLIYSVEDKSKEEKTGFKKIQELPDFQPGFRSRSFLYQLDVTSGLRRRLTHGHLSTGLHDISPDGRELIFSRSQPDYEHRPFTVTTWYRLDLQTLRMDSLFTGWRIGSVNWLPDGRRLLITGGPSAFNGVGKTVPEDVIPNDYDNQAFIYQLESGEVTPISRDFNPSLGGAVQGKDNDVIYFAATDRSYNQVFAYDLKKNTFTRLNCGTDIVHSFDAALNAPVAVFTGNGVSQPPKAYVMDLKKGRVRVLADPEAATYRHVRFGKSEDWTFQNAEGTDILGRVYYPPGFDEAKKYPAIVYYYGGTSPVTRDFGGRYPKEIWAANGYVVYVLQPSGATGFGQAFSTAHVNNWGKTVADEIIKGTKEFLDAHPFVDRERVGCIGASYGGFMTMLLVTKTDLFATAVAHAGISDITSYWGEGYWGYLYSATATAGSYPWNRRDIYVDQSPLFSADKVNTPILMTHGAVDTNVPRGESIQFYTALKLLGKEAELVFVDGQNHLIMTYSKRIRWTKTIIAWFDRKLKGQDEWWNALYPEK